MLILQINLLNILKIIISIIRLSFYIHHHQDDDLDNNTFSAHEAEDIESLHTTNDTIYIHYISEFSSITGEDLNYMLSKLNSE